MSNSKNLKGMKNPNMARHFSPEARKLIGEKSKGNTNTKGKTWWTNGTESCMAFECPGEGWVKRCLKNFVRTARIDLKIKTSVKSQIQKFGKINNTRQILKGT